MQVRSSQDIKIGQKQLKFSTLLMIISEDIAIFHDCSFKLTKNGQESELSKENKVKVGIYISNISNWGKFDCSGFSIISCQN